MKAFREMLTATDQGGTVIGHVNISDLAGLAAVLSAARQRGVPVAVGLSESEREFMGTPQAAALVRSIREEHSQPIYLNADHTHSLSCLNTVTSRPDSPHRTWDVPNHSMETSSA
jgi:fructose-bisphosphate aldolase class II